MNKVCIKCGAEHLGGEPLHCCSYNYENQYYCMECIDWYSRALWPDDTFGPWNRMPIPTAEGRPS
jgi:hypothetical protein